MSLPAVRPAIPAIVRFTTKHIVPTALRIAAWEFVREFVIEGTQDIIDVSPPRQAWKSAKKAVEQISNSFRRAPFQPVARSAIEDARKSLRMAIEANACVEPLQVLNARIEGLRRSIEGIPGLPVELAHDLAPRDLSDVEYQAMRTSMGCPPGESILEASVPIIAVAVVAGLGMWLVMRER